ncbi:hypothetical protein OPT61_g5442 [Boeremia exigua]|uniref:Uncharacterized protein n=1 Tax=Boeremia exigua TaxID=749465 RepID=A0ACC2IAI6_9PLEO|nr:hypothetical protein OPT61_g5442 [Boeremia exigua]
MHSRLNAPSVAAALLCLSQSTYAAPSSLLKRGEVGVLDIKIPANRNDDQFYTVDVDFGGQKFPCLMDTASADHFVATEECSNTNSSDGCFGLESRYVYTGKEDIVPDENFFSTVGTGSVWGKQALMNIGLGGITVEKIGTGLLNESAVEFFQGGSFSGLLGLGFLSVSRQYYFNNRLPLLDTLLQAKTLAKPLFSISLPRLGDPDSPKTGTLTIGGIEAGRSESDIQYHEVLPTPNYNLENFEPDLQGWIIEMTSLRMNGKEIEVSALLDKKNRSLSFIDSGAQKIMLRTKELDAVAAAFNGPIVYHQQRDLYFDCSIPQLLELKFGDDWYPIDPLDLIIPSNHGNSNGTELCLSALSSWTRTFADSILGVPFLRSAFSVYDFVSNDAYTVPPQVGLTSLVNAEAAVARYPSLYKARLL